MTRAFDDVDLAPDVRAVLTSLFEASSTYLVDGTAEGVAADRHGVAAAWDRQMAVEQLVAAIRAQDSARALALMETAAPVFERDRAALLSVFALIFESGEAALLAEFRTRLAGDPALARDQYVYGRTLLNAAAETGCLEAMSLLLEAGADPNAGRQTGHTPLYSLCNAVAAGRGPEAVRLLVNAGADVNAVEGSKRTTALHMAARRGQALVCKALVECGADPEARDSAGETPLRRAVNCGKTEAAAMLLSLGANRDSIGSKGLKAWQAARTPAMKKLFVR